MVTTVLPTMYPQLTNIEYHFTEAGHGKSESDGVGGWVKTTLDKVVGAGTHVATYDAVVQCLKEKAVKTLIETVTPKDVLDMEKKIPKDLETFKGTMKVHHYSWTKEKNMEVYFSSVSCMECSCGTQCIHFGLPGSPWKIKSACMLEAERTEDPMENSDSPPRVEQRQAALSRPKNITTNSWVAVMYQGIWYPGKVKKIIKMLKTPIKILS